MIRAVCIALFIAALGVSVFAADPECVLLTDQMSDEEVRRYRDAQVAELERRAKETKPTKTPEGTVYRIFYCTLYYTPKESGFTAERGFDAAPITAPGLGGRTYARSFLQAVKKEGFGRLKEPVDGRNYLQYTGGNRYRFAKAPLGSRGNVLVPRKSTAISKKAARLRHGIDLVIDSPTVEQVTGSREWTVSDVGGGVHPLQIDLYWGEDEPMGPVGRQTARPAGTKLEYAFDLSVVIK
jgi:hypothetical protein